MARLLRDYPIANNLIREAEDTLDRPLAALLLEPFAPELTSRENQVRLYLGSVALWTVAEAEGIVPTGKRRIIFGASAGETAAMMVAGFYDFTSGLRLADSRGAEMHKASIINPGEMLVASGLPFEAGEQIADEIPGVYAVNDNPGMQTVFSGTRVAISALHETLADSGQKIKLYRPDILEAAHTWHMKPGVKGLKKAVRSTRMRRRPQYDFMGNQAKLVQSARKAKKHLTNQLTRGVLLTQSADKLYNNYNVRTFVDVGQGKVLYGQMKRQFKHQKGLDTIKLISVVDELLPEEKD